MFTCRRLFCEFNFNFKITCYLTHCDICCTVPEIFSMEIKAITPLLCISSIVIIYDKAPGLYLASLNTYGNESYVLLKDEKHPVVTG